jgi:NTP pyrophosphatase (non-canonical NTP hydrolase)
MTPDHWKTIAHLVAWLDANNGTGEQERQLRLLKLTEEAGEVAQAVIGTLGQNPRKGITHTPGDVADELCDVIVTAMVALHDWTDDPAATLERKLAACAARAEVDIDA